MTEEKVKNRGWVKNAAIIFLSVMLLLTFFSQTILNRSLPEVAAQYAQSGTITTRIRGTGTIAATETFEVKAKDARKVKSVAVKVGDAVEVGDLLVTLAEGDSSELEAARQALESAQFSYQSALLDMDTPDENGETSDITRAKQKLTDAIEARKYVISVTLANIYDAKTAYMAAQSVADARELAYNEAEAKLSAAGGYTPGGSGNADYSAVEAAKAALAPLEIQYKNELAFISKLAEVAYQKAKNTTSIPTDAQKEPYARAIVNTFAELSSKASPVTLSAYFADAATELQRRNLFIDGVVIDDATFKPLVDVLPDQDVSAVAGNAKAVLDARKALADAERAYYNAASDSSAVNAGLKAAVDKAKAAWDADALVAKTAKAKYDDLTAKKADWDAANQAVLDAQDSLETATQSLAKNNLNLQQLRAAVARAQKQVTAASGGGAGGEIFSDVAGVVKAINTTAGNTTDPNTPVLTIEVPDRGYSVSMSVTVEQAKKVSVGDSADITTNNWGAPTLTGRLAAIRPDPQNPQTNKQLVFEITGEDVQSGTQVSVSIGQRSQNYDVIVPNSAVREDANGSFVLVIIAKPSPLGNRYTATRADVQVLAKDDTNTAVSGGVAAWDFVLTSSTKPIESGMQVRMAENG